MFFCSWLRWHNLASCQSIFASVLSLAILLLDVIDLNNVNLSSTFSFSALRCSVREIVTCFSSKRSSKGEYSDLLRHNIKQTKYTLHNVFAFKWCVDGKWTKHGKSHESIENPTWFTLLRQDLFSFVSAFAVSCNTF